MMDDFSGLTDTELKNNIEGIIKAAAANSGIETRYREPLIGFASTDDPIFKEMKEIIGPYNLHPKEIFPEFNQTACGKCATGPCALKSC